MTATEQENSAITVRTEDETGWIKSALERLARTLLGQIALRQLDKFLWVIEKSAEWSLSQNQSLNENDENEDPHKKSELVRPLPWILFLPGLVILRSLRVSLNIGAIIFRLPAVEPITVVRFMQKSRRRLKALRNNPSESPSRTRLRRKDKRLSMNEAKKALIRSIRLTLSTLSCLDGSKPSLSPPPTRIHISAHDLDAVTAVTPEEKSATESMGSQHVKLNREERTPSISSDNSLDEPLQEKIDRLARENSSDDPDFLPPTNKISSDNDDDNKDDNDDNNSNDDDNSKDDSSISESELRDITEDAKSLSELDTVDQQQDPKTIDQQRDLELKTPTDEHCDKAECDLSPQNANSKETSIAPSQDGDTFFYSPVGDAPFYSPVSSTCSSSNTPERSTSPIANQNSHTTDGLKTNEFGNGEAHFVSGSTISGRSCEEANNGTVMEKRGTNVSKHHHRGKRTSHGNRKKK